MTAQRRTAGKSPAAAPESAPGNRGKILATALRLFTEYGVDATPTARISKEAGVSTGTLFHYFPDKDRLVGALYLSIKKEMAAAIRNNADPSLPTKPRIEKAIRGFIFWGMTNPLKVRFIDQCYNYPGIGEDVQQEIYEEFSWMEGLMQTAIREGLLADLPFEFHGTMLYQIMSGILSLIGSGESGMSDEAIIENGLAMLWKK
ncbi:MAG: transcriptional regulator BetI [Methanoregula sp. PtaU1.Bin006]|nr:MAG: transcriptional regulator BetI [Methanoregula sp. PtaB.Bin085]OPY36321.1 MAG: transcriptional regulator BetI [Methanoregula sp. PtaU1.Bin006]